MKTFEELKKLDKKNLIAEIEEIGKEAIKIAFEINVGHEKGNHKKENAKILLAQAKTLLHNLE